MWIELEAAYEDYIDAEKERLQLLKRDAAQTPAEQEPTPQTLDGFADRLRTTAPPSLTSADLLELDFLAEHAWRVLSPTEAVDWITEQASDFLIAGMWKGLLPIALRLSAAIGKNAPDEEAEARVARLLGNVYFEVGRLDLAEAHYQRCIDLSWEDGLERDLASAQYGLARMFHVAGRDEDVYDVCMDVYVSAFHITGPDSDRDRDAWNMRAAWLLSASGAPEDAVRMMRRAWSATASDRSDWTVGGSISVERSRCSTSVTRRAVSGR
jgi:tetratricopeptide (TPR) repeat protein